MLSFAKSREAHAENAMRDAEFMRPSTNFPPLAPPPTTDLPSVEGRSMLRTLAEFENACLVEIANQQMHGEPALIGLLCDAVRLAREFVDYRQGGGKSSKRNLRAERFAARHAARNAEPGA